MPKIIEDLESRLIGAACQQIEEAGYGAVTIRSIAKACGVGVGTVYNYFPSKDALIAAYLLTDWSSCIAAIEAAAEQAEHPRPVLLCIYEQLLDFTQRHASIFRDKTAAASFSGSFGHYHALLRSQLAAPVRKFAGSDFAADFIAESLLTWTMAGRPFEQIYELLIKLF